MGSPPLWSRALPSPGTRIERLLESRPMGQLYLAPEPGADRAVTLKVLAAPAAATTHGDPDGPEAA